jgi:hypothetical protein
MRGRTGLARTRRGSRSKLGFGIWHGRPLATRPAAICTKYQSGPVPLHMPVTQLRTAHEKTTLKRAPSDKGAQAHETYCPRRTTGLSGVAGLRRMQWRTSLARGRRIRPPSPHCCSSCCPRPRCQPLQRRQGFSLDDGYRQRLYMGLCCLFFFFKAPASNNDKMK